MLFTCECKHQSHIHKGYQPKEGTYEPWLCPKCGKEWELYMGRHGLSVNEVQKDKKKL
jgi:hypothetical protein